jgi:DNA-binding GntR family transcriptional regulator
MPRPLTGPELAEPFAISLPAISRHLKVLEHAGLIARSRSAQWRSSSLQAEPLREATAWMDRYRRFWDVNFTRLDAHLARMQQQQSPPHDDDTTERTPS